MSILQAIILGVVQGITEFLPISSSGHLIAFPTLFGWGQQGVDFDVMIHVATLLAIVWVLRTEVAAICRNFFSGNDRRLGWMILVGTIPVVVAGVLIAGEVLDEVRTVKTVAYSLIGWGVVLWAADYYATRVKPRTTALKVTTWKQAVVIGLAQALALIPGTSRSGITMTAGLFSGLDRDTSARYSFLLAIPAIAGAGLLTLKEAFDAGGFSTEALPLIVGFVSAFLAGMIAIRFLLAFVKKYGFQWFAWYRILLGIVLLGFFV